MNKNLFFILIVFLLSGHFSLAQEVEKDLPYNPAQAAQHARERSFDPRSSRGGGNLTLPFFDDFSRYSLPTDDPEIPVEWQLWENDDVFINASMPVAPPTIGVATFDGVSNDGCPYDFPDPNSYGGADTLTSLPINLGGLTAADSVKLMFFYEPGGLGNFPEEEDSLILEFYSPFGAGQWLPKWSVAGNNNGSFTKVLITIIEPEFLLDGFRFRFRNYATLSGSTDHWHLDYVVLDDQFEFVECLIDDVAMQDPVRTLLQEYTAMPWTHFTPDPAAYMADEIDFSQNNLGPTANIATGFKVEYKPTSQVWDFPAIDLNTFGNGCQEIDRTLSLGDFVYDTDVNDTCAIFDVSVYCTTTDPTPQNDTTRFLQDFTNYYAYDDGTAERAYAINTTGGKVAVKYFAEEPDSLLGLFMYWLPFQIDQSDQNFLLRVWGDGGGEPGEEIGENFIFYSPNYYCDGYNIFGYYAYDEPIFISGNFYVGWVQDNNAELNIGNDKSGTSNATKLFFQNGGTADWQNSLVSGSVMIRPVFKSGKDSVWNYIEQFDPGNILVYPNPAENEIHIAGIQQDFIATIYDPAGRMVSDMNCKGDCDWDISHLAPGVYSIVIRIRSGEAHIRKFMKQ